VGEIYTRNSFKNVKEIMGENEIVELGGADQIREAVKTGGGSGDWGYRNNKR